MITIKMKTYDIFIEKGIFTDIKKHLPSDQSRIFVVTDKNVDTLYGNELKNVFKDIDIIKFVINPGEASKTFLMYQTMIDTFLKQGIKRFDTIVAFGGGVVGDLAGFVAATLFRGVDYIQIPTTLLAQVDSSIGAKTGIDTAYGKNLIGAFYEPKKVIIDPNFLKTLSSLEYANGLAEMIKAGLIKDQALFESLEKQIDVDEKMIEQAILVKRSLVLNDPFDKKERMLLNFGHTFGHAIEFKHHYTKYKHGQAIAYGMLMAIKLGERLNITPNTIYERVLNLFLKLKLVEEPLLDPKDYLDFLAFDKKHLGHGLNFVFLKTIGLSETKIVDLKELF